MRAHDPDGPELVGAVARRLGVSVRTLHHWDALGVASPSGRTAGGYRAYSPADIAYLRRVMLFRELGIELAAIPALLDTSGQTRRHELAEVRRKLGDKITDLQRLAKDLDRLLDAHEGGPRPHRAGAVRDLRSGLGSLVDAAGAGPVGRIRAVGGVR